MVEASGLSLRQERALAITPKFGASLSIPCSMFIIYEVYLDHRTRGTNSVQHALVGMSTVDILASSAWFISTWAVPKGSFVLSAGNRATCNFQGFLLQLAVGAPLYNSSLALFYLLIIKKRWTDDQLARIEKWVHGFILTFTIGTSILLLFLEQYNHIGAVCWVIGEPRECGNSSFHSSDVPCERGNYAYLWGVLLFYGPLWICVIGCCASMVILYLEVRKTHQRARQYSDAIEGMRHSMNRSGDDSSKVATQAILYSLSFVITWMPSTMWSIAHWFNWKHYGLDMAAAAAEPLQGFWNLLIFLRSRPKTVRKIKNVLSTLLPCCCRFASSEYDFRVSFISGLRGSRLSSTNFSTLQLSDAADLSGQNNSSGDNITRQPSSLNGVPPIKEETESENDSKPGSDHIDVGEKCESPEATACSNNDTDGLQEELRIDMTTESDCTRPTDDRNLLMKDAPECALHIPLNTSKFKCTDMNMASHTKNSHKETAWIHPSNRTFELGGSATDLAKQLGTPHTPLTGQETTTTEDSSGALESEEAVDSPGEQLVGDLTISNADEASVPDEASLQKLSTSVCATAQCKGTATAKSQEAREHEGPASVDSSCYDHVGELTLSI